MNTKGRIAPLVTAMLVVTIFTAMIGMASAGINVGLYKGSVNGYTFNIGDTIDYEMTVTNNDPGHGISVAVTDTLPNGTLVVLDPNLVLAAGPGATSPTYAVSYVVELADIQTDGKVHNTLTVTGENTNGEDIDLGITPKNPIDTGVTFNFGYEGVGCMEVELTGESTGSVAWHRWSFGDGTQSSVITGAPTASNAVTYPYTTCGTKTVKLFGESTFGDYGEKEKTIDVACEPEVTAGRTPTGCVEIGDSVTFTSSITTPGTPPYSYLWTFTNGLASSSNPTVTHTIPAGGTTATLTVTDNLDCEGYDIVSVNICSPPHEPPSDVPILTPTGMVALIGMLCIAGAGRILTKGRRS